MVLGCILSVIALLIMPVCTKLSFTQYIKELSNEAVQFLSLLSLSLSTLGFHKTWVQLYALILLQARKENGDFLHEWLWTNEGD